MARNAEVIRQWKLLLHLDERGHGCSVDDLARQLSVTKRTVWRDLAALQEAGFPLVDEKRDRRTVWRVMKLPLKALTDAGMSVAEVCSLYMGREMLLTLTGTPFESGVNSLIRKVQKTLSRKTREFLDALPNIVRVRPMPRKKVPAGYNELVASLIDASARRKVANIRYFSASSNRQKDYVVHPYTVQYADGGLYLQAYVPEYDEFRWFGVERVKKCIVSEKGFTPIKAVEESDFNPGLGLGNGRPEVIVLEFSARVAPYVTEREWHKSQIIERLEDGNVRLTMKVARDWSLHGFVLGWGADVRVVQPTALAEDIFTMLDQARERYVPKFDFDEAIESAPVKR